MTGGMRSPYSPSLPAGAFGLTAPRQHKPRAAGSHGVGLRVTEAIVLRHGGPLEASEENGLIVSIGFPVARASLAQEPKLTREMSEERRSQPLNLL
jgi:hypothetical protein